VPDTCHLKRRIEPSEDQRLSVLGPLEAATWLLMVTLAGCGDADGEPVMRVPLEAELRERLTVGMLDGPEEFVFGRIDDVRALADGSFLVLDGMARQLRWYGPDGTYRGGITSVGGRARRTPGAQSDDRPSG
jgi:hypothetical protein